MTRQRDTRPPLDELRLGLLSTAGQQPLRIAGDGALVRLSDGTLGVVSTLGQATKKMHVLTEQGSVRVDGDQLVQIWPIRCWRLSSSSSWPRPSAR